MKEAKVLAAHLFLFPESRRVFTRLVQLVQAFWGLSLQKRMPGDYVESFTQKSCIYFWNGINVHID